MVRQALIQRYAKAFFDAGQSTGKLSAMLASLEALAELSASSAELHAVFTHPAFATSERVTLLKSLSVKLEMPGETLALVVLLARNGHLEALHAIAADVSRLVAESEGRVAGELHSAVSLSDADVASLREAVRANLGKTVEFTMSVDPALLGGVRVKVGSLVFDGTVRGHIERLRARFRAV